MSVELPAEVQAYYDAHGHLGYAHDQEASHRQRLAAELPPLASFPCTLDVDISALPTSMGVRKWYAIEAQGQVGQCGGEMRAGQQELAYFRQTRGNVIQLNRRFAYLSAQRLDGTMSDSGSTISGNAQAAKQYGCCLESDWPVSSDGRYPVGRGWRAVPAEAWEEAKAFRVNSWREIKSYQEALSWLVHGVGGVGIGIPWTIDGAAKVVERYHRGGPLTGWHALAVLDWDKSRMDTRGRPYLWIPNSWGRRMHDDGSFLVSPDVFEQFCQIGNVVGLSDMADIKPRAWDWAKESFV